MKKIILIILIFLLIFNLAAKDCSSAGELVMHANGHDKCCDGLREFGLGCPEDDCNCTIPSIGGLIKCSDCGNGKCERNHLENYCNCPADCKKPEKKIVNSNCGNGKCESKFNERNENCVADCPVPIYGTKKIFDRKDKQNYYEQFRIKCDNNKCCLKSFETAKKLRSEIFFKIMDGDCPLGYGLNQLRCLGSYVWCEKR